MEVLFVYFYYKMCNFSLRRASNLFFVEEKIVHVFSPYPGHHTVTGKF